MTTMNFIDRSDPAPFSYAALDRASEASARADAALIKGLMRRTAEDVIEIGKATGRSERSR